MRTERVKKYRGELLRLRDRAASGANYVAEAISEDIAPPGNSAAPFHLADAASETLEADLGAFHAEIGLLEEINDALDRIESGAFGRCAECGAEIGKSRLDAVPYALRCIQCAEAAEREPQPLG